MKCHCYVQFHFYFQCSNSWHYSSQKSNAHFCIHIHIFQHLKENTTKVSNTIKQHLVTFPWFASNQECHKLQLLLGSNSTSPNHLFKYIKLWCKIALKFTVKNLSFQNLRFSQLKLMILQALKVVLFCLQKCSRDRVEFLCKILFCDIILGTEMLASLRV